MCRSSWSLAVILIAAVSIVDAVPALAVSCSSAAVSVRGEASRLEWIALAKARASWRYRVRNTPELGAAFANWSIADAKLQDCAPSLSGIRCTIAAIPCKP